MNEAELRERLRALAVFDVQLPDFDPDLAPPDPVELFCAWLLEAIDAGVGEPHAMTLSTVDADGHPSSRVLILKGCPRWSARVRLEQREPKRARPGRRTSRRCELLLA